MNVDEIANNVKETLSNKDCMYVDLVGRKDDSKFYKIVDKLRDYKLTFSDSFNDEQKVYYKLRIENIN